MFYCKLLECRIFFHQQGVVSAGRTSALLLEPRSDALHGQTRLKYTLLTSYKPILTSEWKLCPQSSLLVFLAPMSS